MNSILLDQYLKVLAEFLTEDGVTEVMINRPGEVIIEGSHGKRIESVDLTMETLQQLAIIVATFNNQAVSKETPILSATLPGGERIQVITPPAVKNGQFGVAIRKPSTVQISLDEYKANGAYDSTSTDSDEDLEVDDQLLAYKQAHDIDAFMRLAIKSHKNIIIAGGTGSGKTTYANSLMEEIDPDERIITIEDTPELIIPHADHLNMLASKGGQGVAKVDVQALLEASLRLNPDRILLGELRGEEAYHFLNAASTGHPGAISTLHANSAIQAFDRLTLMVQQSGINMTEEGIRAFLHQVIDVVVHWKHDKKTGERVMTGLIFNHRGKS